MEFGLIAGLGRNARERTNAIFLFPRIVDFSSKGGTPLLAERAKTCQHYFWIFSAEISPSGAAPGKGWTMDSADDTDDGNDEAPASAPASEVGLRRGGRMSNVEEAGKIHFTEGNEDNEAPETPGTTRLRDNGQREPLSVVCGQ
jgi:hypothetical protein